MPLNVLKMSKKIFIVTGEVSGDQVAAWYYKKESANWANFYVEAIGGDMLKQAGVTLYDTYDKLNVTGIIEIIAHLPRLARYLYRLVDYLKVQKFDEVVVVDFPGFNLALIKRLKKYIPTLTITYLAPPQLWCWGAWRLKSLRRYADNIVILYPFEQGWYQQHGITTRWMGNPVYDRLEKFFVLSEHKKNYIAVIPGSRLSEINQQFLLFAHVMKRLAEFDQDLSFVIPVADSISEDVIQKILEQAGLRALQERIVLVSDAEEKYRLLAQCCCALTKPGTITLELALLKVPSVVAFRTSWLTYGIGRLFVKVQFMSLPNLLLEQPIFAEYIQSSCRYDNLVPAMKELYTLHKKGAVVYQEKLSICQQLRAEMAEKGKRRA
jgi:lipid-A-disaccharide synthase